MTERLPCTRFNRVDPACPPVACPGWQGFSIAMITIPRSVAVHQVHIHGLVILESEDYAPIARYTDAPHACHVTFQWMQAIARLGRKVTWTPCPVRQGQSPLQLRHPLLGQLSRVILLGQSPKSLVLDPHEMIVACNVMRCTLVWKGHPGALPVSQGRPDFQRPVPHG